MAIPSRLSPPAMKASLDPSWLQFTFSDLWEKNAERFPEQEAIVDSEKRFTWSEANQWINQVADGFLQLGYKKDDGIVIQLPNCVEIALLRIACERAGLICVPISRMLRGKEVEYILNKVGARMFITIWKFRDFDYFEMIEEVRNHLAIDHILMVDAEVPEGVIPLRSFLKEEKEEATYKSIFQNRKCSPEEFSLVTHTTGTTGFPKFVENPIFSRMELAKAQAERIRMTPSDVIGLLSPTAGGPNTLGYFTSPLVGAKVVMVEHFEPEEAMKRIAKEGITILPVVPTMVIKMTDHPKFKDYDLRSLRVIVSAGAIFNYHDAMRAEEMIGCPIIQFYGSVDCGLGVMHSPMDPREIRLTTVGKPLGRYEIKLLKENGEIAAPGEEGEALVRSRDCLSGYFRDGEANRAVWDKDGWFRLEDLGKLDQEGNLAILGRKKDIIIRGGQNIIPSEIEGILSKYEKVDHAAVIGMPDKIMGEKVCAYVIPKKGEKMTMEELNEFLKRNRVAYYKLLERLEIVEELPTVGEKVDKKMLVKEIRQKLESEKLIS